MQRRTNISTKFDAENDKREGTTFCYHCHKKFQDEDEIIIDREYVIEKWDAFENANMTMPIRHPRYHIGCYFLLKSQNKLPKPNKEEMKNLADYHNWQVEKNKREMMLMNGESIFATKTKRRKI